MTYTTAIQPNIKSLPLWRIFRYGFQGQEEDNEVWQGGVAFQFRIEDARLGRFLSIDPLLASYPFYSTYQFSGNRLIDMLELEGLEPKSAGKVDGETAKAEHADYPKAGELEWSWFNDQWNLIAGPTTEITASNTNTKAIVFTMIDKATGEEVLVGSIRNDFVSAKMSLGETSGFDPNHRQIADFQKFDREADGNQDAEIISLSYGGALVAGAGISIVAVSMDRGIFIYLRLDLHLGVKDYGGGISFATLEFNHDCGRNLDGDLLVGGSQGWSWALGPFSDDEVTSYADGEWHLITYDETVLYTITTIDFDPMILLPGGLTNGEANYSFSKTFKPIAKFPRSPSK